MRNRLYDGGRGQVNTKREGVSKLKCPPVFISHLLLQPEGGEEGEVVAQRLFVVLDVA